MICNDRFGATFVATSVVTLGLFLGTFAAARADAPAVTAPTTAVAASAAPAPLADAASPAPLSVMLVVDDLETSFPTTAKTVRDFLIERGITVTDDDFVSIPQDQPLSDGLRIAYRAAVPVVIQEGSKRLAVRTSAASIGEMLATAHIAVAQSDDVTPALTTRPLAHEIVHVSHVVAWTGKLFEPIAARVRDRYDSSLPKGIKRTLVAGYPGQRVIDVRYVKRDDARPTRTVLAMRVVRKPQEAVVAVGTGSAASAPAPAPYASLASAAQAGLESAVKFAGNAIHMIATAYTAGCYGCSGITASGVRAGLGVVAVDPRIIPLGTKLWIPGYGRAVAGDTGGAINGNRIDLGMNSLGDALRFGRRDITVYVIR